MSKSNFDRIEINFVQKDGKSETVLLTKSSINKLSKSSLDYRQTQVLNTLRQQILNPLISRP